MYRLLSVFAVKESVSKQSLLYVRHASVCWRVIETTLESTLISSKRTQRRTQRSVRNVRVVYAVSLVTFMNDTVNLSLCCMADRPSSAAPRWQAASGVAVGLT